MHGTDIRLCITGFDWCRLLDRNVLKMILKVKTSRYMVLIRFHDYRVTGRENEKPYKHDKRVVKILRNPTVS